MKVAELGVGDLVHLHRYGRRTGHPLAVAQVIRSTELTGDPTGVDAVLLATVEHLPAGYLLWVEDTDEWERLDPASWTPEICAIVARWHLIQGCSK